MMKTDEQPLDSKDRRILFECDLDAGLSDAALARRCGLSQSVFSYRLHRLEEAGFIRGYTLMPNLSKFGKVAYGVYCRASHATERELESFMRTLDRNPNIYWTTRLAGEYDLLAAFSAADPRRFLKQMSEVFPGKLKRIDSSIVLRVRLIQFQRSYLVKAAPTKRKVVAIESGGVPSNLSALDSNILECVADKPRIGYTECAALLGVDRATVKRRLSALTETGFISGIITMIDCRRFGYQSYLLLLYTNSFAEKEREKILSVARESPYATTFIETIGPWQAEIHIEVPDPEILQQQLSFIRATLGPVLRELRVIMNVGYYEKFRFPVGAE